MDLPIATYRSLITTLASLAAIVRIHEGNKDPKIVELLAKADEHNEELIALIGEPKPLNPWTEDFEPRFAPRPQGPALEVFAPTEFIENPPTPTGFGVIRKALDEAHPLPSEVMNDKLEAHHVIKLSGHVKDVQPMQAEMAAWPYFTVWVRESDGTGTCHVSVHQCPDIETAKGLALDETRADWGPEYENDISVMGVTAGNVQVLEWDDDL